MPKGYICAEVEITNLAASEKYRPLAAASIAAFGGRNIGQRPRWKRPSRSCRTFGCPTGGAVDVEVQAVKAIGMVTAAPAMIGSLFWAVLRAVI